MTDSRVGRILLERERAARVANEGAASIAGEGLRSAFTIHAGHVLTAWHCVREAAERGDPLWFRLRDANARTNRRYKYLPVRMLDQDRTFDIAVLVVDGSRLGEAGLSGDDAEKLLAGSIIPLGVDVSVHESVQVVGFPANAPSADSDTFPARVVDLTLPLGEVTGLKLVGESFAAVAPIDPHGLSGGPVLKSGSTGVEVAVGVVRSLPIGRYPDAALGGALIATRIEDVAGRLPQIAAALLAEVPSTPVMAGRAWRADTSLAGLLRADAELVDYFGRDHELRDLHAWCDGSAERAAQLVTGPGGQGKTRMARQLCRELAASGSWAARMLRGPGDATAVDDLCRRTAAAGRSLLLVVDYAGEYGAAAFAELIGVLTGDSVRLPRWRLLLLARNAGDWWQPEASGGGSGTAVRPQLMAGGAEVPEIELALEPLIPDPQARGPAFGRILAQLRPAVEASASELGMAVAEPPVVPDLSGADLGSALMLHMAAIVSLLPPGGRPVKPAEQSSASDLINRVLDLECERHWLYEDASAARLYRPTEVAFGDLAHGDRATVETAIAAATLAGAPTAYAAAQLVNRALDVGQARARNIARWLHDLYPVPEGSVGTTWLPPLQPDRLGEELVARVIRREQAEGTPPDQLLPRRILGSSPESLAAAQVHRLLIVMIRAGSRDRDIADLLADATGHGGLLHDIPDEIDLRVVADALPQKNTNLLGAAAAITAHALRHYDLTQPGWRELDLQAESTCPKLHQGARLLNNLGNRLGDAGRWEEALAPANEAVEIRRRLAEANPAAYLPDLAASLNNLGIRLGDVGRGEEALAPANEAVEIRRRLAEANPAAELPGLAGSLNNLRNRLSDVGRREEARAAADEAVEIRRRLAEADPAAYLPDLAGSLDNLGSSLGQVGRWAEALAQANEAVEIRRRLAEANPAAYLPDLAESLVTLGGSLGQVGRWEEALAPANEAVEIRRRLAEANPAAYLPNLAVSLAVLGGSLGQVGRWEEALALANEAVELYRRLAQAIPAAYLADLAMSLVLGGSLGQVGQQEEALPAANEGVEFCRRLAEANPAAHLPTLAASLVALGGSLGQAGRWEEALAAANEAVELYTRLAEANPAAYLPALAASLALLGSSLGQVGQQEEALAAANKAVEIRRPLAEANPAAHLPDLALSLAILGDILDGVGRGEEADQAWDGAAARLGPEAHVLRLLRAGWEWVLTPTYKAERDHLASHPGLLATGSENQLAQILRYQPPDEAERYLALIATARANGVDYAYLDLT